MIRKGSWGGCSWRGAIIPGGGVSIPKERGTKHNEKNKKQEGGSMEGGKLYHRIYVRKPSGGATVLSLSWNGGSGPTNKKKKKDCEHSRTKKGEQFEKNPYARCDCQGESKI